MEFDLFVRGVRPFGMGPAEKARFLKAKLAELRDYHAARCQGYAQLVNGRERGTGRARSFFEDYPFVPVSLFKEYELRSSADGVAVVSSSSTTSAAPSRILVDKASRKRQARSAHMILTDFIGEARRPYIVFDTEATVRGSKAFSARGAAILSLAPLSSSLHFVMKETADGLVLDEQALFDALEEVEGGPFIAYGFTSVLYQAHASVAKLALEPAHPDSVLLHSGGWKKLTELAVDKASFTRVVSSPWALEPHRVIDFYGLVEQVGVPYPDCPFGAKHVPYWADVLIRRADTLESAEPGEPGLIQLMSALPLAGPNHSVLTEDIGRIERLDGCPCGRAGTAFVFDGRAPKSELRGCSDVVRR